MRHIICSVWQLWRPRTRGDRLTPAGGGCQKSARSCDHKMRAGAAGREAHLASRDIGGVKMGMPPIPAPGQDAADRGTSPREPARSQTSRTPQRSFDSAGETASFADGDVSSRREQTVPKTLHGFSELSHANTSLTGNPRAPAPPCVEQK